MQSHIAEFATDMSAFGRRTRTRLIGEFAVSVIAVMVLAYPPLLESIAGWVRLIVGALIVGYFLYDLISLPASKRLASQFRLYVYDDGISLKRQGVPEKILYTDIRRYKPQKRGDEIVGIRLETQFGISIDLNGLQNMEELHKILKAHLPL